VHQLMFKLIHFVLKLSFDLLGHASKDYKPRPDVGLVRETPSWTSVSLCEVEAGRA
jgi:hypothetical protein